MNLPNPSISLNRAAPGPVKQDIRFSYKDFCQWPEIERWELIDGAAFATSAQGYVHQHISAELTDRFQDFFKKNGAKVFAAPFDVRFPEFSDAADHEIFTVVQPDISVVCNDLKLDDRGCIGPPDLIAEIITPSSAMMDKNFKRNIYERYGVREYWMIQPQEKSVVVHWMEKHAVYSKEKIFSFDDRVDSITFKGLNIYFYELYPSL